MIVEQTSNTTYYHFNDGSTYTLTCDDRINIQGAGTYGDVYRVTNTSNKMVYALKEIHKNKGLTDDKIKLETETMMKFKDNKNINVNYSHVIGENGSKAYVIMPYYDCNCLSTLIQKNEIKTEQEIVEYFRQICYGMREIHSNGLIHRDLKTDNILAKMNNECTQIPMKYILVVGDFGMLRNSDSSEKTISAGTPYTKAPEISLGKYDQQSDVFSLGCILYKMLTKKEAFNGSTEKEIQTNKEKGIPDAVIDSMNLDPLTAYILKGCLKNDISERITNKELYEKLDLDHLYPSYSKLIPSKFENKVTKKIEKPKKYIVTYIGVININKKEKQTKEYQSNIPEKSSISDEETNKLGNTSFVLSWIMLIGFIAYITIPIITNQIYNNAILNASSQSNNTHDKNNTTTTAVDTTSIIASNVSNVSSATSSVSSAISNVTSAASNVSSTASIGENIISSLENATLSVTNITPNVSSTANDVRNSSNNSTVNTKASGTKRRHIFNQ